MKIVKLKQMYTVIGDRMVTYENSKTETDVYSNLGDRMVTYENSKTETDVYSNLGDRMVTYEMLFQFLISKELLNDIQDINSYDIRHNIFEEFCNGRCSGR